ncbi:MAG: dephospho-CoA kinase [Pyrinomonadaceae bacterium]
MLRVGLTGSIGVGKSFVAKVLAESGCHVLDADQTAREVVRRKTAGLGAVVEAFGEEVLREDGELDRARLGAIVFADEGKRALLNATLHPFIIAAQDKQLNDWEEKYPDEIAVIDAALMIESGGYKRFDKLIVVHCRPELQLERLMARNNFTLEEATRRINTQMPQKEKLRFADYRIDTSEGFASARRQAEDVYRRLRLLISDEATLD